MKRVSQGKNEFRVVLKYVGVQTTWTSGGGTSQAKEKVGTETLKSDHVWCIQRQNKRSRVGWIIKKDGERIENKARKVGGGEVPGSRKDSRS